MYKNAARSEKLIKMATIKLLSEKKDIDKITVSEVVSLADINRGTFYNHYKDIDDVMNQIEDEIMEDLIKKWENSKSESGLKSDSFIIELTKTLIENEDICHKLVNSVPTHVFTDIKMKIVDAVRSSPYFSSMGNEELAYLAMISGGISTAYLDYFTGKSNLTLEEIGQYAVSLTHIVFLDKLKEN